MDPYQPSLFGETPPPQDPASDDTIDAAFAAFHALNPHVYSELVALARQLRRRGHQRIGIGMLFEVLRYQRALETVGDDFKLNNNYRSRYARLIDEREADLRGAFEMRELRSE